MSLGYLNHYEMKKNRLKVLQKHNYQCQICGGKATIIHHADESKENHDPDNLIPLCSKCHVRLHKSTSKIVWDIDMVKMAMMHRGMDKGELAKKAGMTNTNLSVIFRNGTTKNSTMKKIAEVLDYPIETFIASVPDSEESSERTVKSSASRLFQAINKRAEELAGPDDILKNRYRYWIRQELKKKFGVKNYASIEECDVDLAVSCISTWLNGSGFNQ